MGSEAADSAAPTGLDTNEKMLPEFFRQGGYSTHMIGKWHLGFCKPGYRPTNRGFDTSFGLFGGQIDYYKHTVGVHQFVDYFRNDQPVDSKAYCGKDFTTEAINIAKVSKMSFYLII